MVHRNSYDFGVLMAQVYRVKDLKR